MIALDPANAAQVAPASGPSPRYALITSARNEEFFIEHTIRSVLAQTLQPVQWIIVSDGSTDRTETIVRRYAADHPWIQLVRLPPHCDRQFAAKATCFNAGYARIEGIAYDYIANLDADISFPADYFEFLLGKFASMPDLGVAGTPFVENHGRAEVHSYNQRLADLGQVSGACQVFRRECFNQIGGYVPVKVGALDWIAVTTARMNGWETQTFVERVCFHHRKLGTGKYRFWAVPFQYGRKAYSVGGHPVWELLRGVLQMRQRPWVVGGLLFYAGYLWANIRHTPRPVPPQFVAFHRREQMHRLRLLFHMDHAHN